MATQRPARAPRRTQMNVPPREQVRPRTARGGKPQRSSRLPAWLPYALIGLPLAFMMLVAMLVGLGALLLYGSGAALPGVQVAGEAVGGMTEQEIAASLSGWQIALTDGESTLTVDPAVLGVTLDTAATARAAVGYGRGEGSALRAVFSQIEVPLVLYVDPAAAEQGLASLASQIEQAPINAGVQLVNGQAQPRPAVNGRGLDIAASAAPLASDAGAALADGTLELVTYPIAPEITDPTPIVNAAAALLANPLRIRAYDPIEDESFDWNIPPAEWGNWLTAEPDPNASIGLRVSLDEGQLQAYFGARVAELGGARTLDMDEATEAVQTAIGRGETESWTRVYYNDRQHVVQAGESIISIAWDYGIPYPWVQQANPGVETLSVGQTITIPSPDTQVPLPVVPNKRIVVSISEQRTRVYENGALKWDWISSTGISSSPTWPGVYQVLMHETNAYAGNWDLWMPNFIGVYHPVPGAEFINGFHGFPTRGGSQLLWTNSLGTRVTYGCILLSNENVTALYSWAEEGVIVEILP
jgi:lipoprotein-anchoring transpeptidase ErfK/SrfK